VLRSRIYLLFGICLAAADLAASPAVNLQEARAAIDQRFADELETLAKKCESLKLDQQAQQTRAWLIDRDPQRQYIFLPDQFDSKKPPAAAHEFVRFWHKHFLSVREKHAEELFELSKHLLEQHQPANAYQLLHEVLRDAPDHDEARRILGYRKHLGSWRREASRVSSRVARVRHALFDWPPRSYWRVETPHFEIATNLSVKEGKSLGEELELLYDVWQQMFYRYWASEQELVAAFEGERRPKRPAKKHRVVLFRNRADYVAQMQQHVPGIEVSSGFYAEKQRTSYFYAGDESDVAMWFHEATHQLFYELGPGVADVGIRSNSWIVEAVALYMESLLVHDDYVTLGGFDALRLQNARFRAWNHRFYLPLAELIPMGRDDLQKDERLARLYSQSAGLAHFLMDYKRGRYRDAMVSYLQVVYAGRDRNDTLEKLVGTPLLELDKAYQELLDVTDAQVIRYLRPLNTLTKLNLGHTSITDAALGELATATKLEWLDLTDTDVTDKGVQNLRGAVNLVRLSLEGTQVTNKSLETIEKLKRIEELDLSRTKITDDGLSSLAALRNLKELWLTGTSVSDAGIEYLGSLKGLEKLETSGTRVTAEGRARLRRGLPKLEE
jgi:hypothetical protein